MVVGTGVDPVTYRFQAVALPTELPDLWVRTASPQGACAVLTGFEPAASTLTGWRSLQTDLQDPSLGGPNDMGTVEVVHRDDNLQPSRTPYGIRTRVTGVKGRRPRPLDEWGLPPGGPGRNRRPEPMVRGRRTDRLGSVRGSGGFWWPREAGFVSRRGCSSQRRPTVQGASRATRTGPRSAPGRRRVPGREGRRGRSRRRRAAHRARDGGR